MLFIGKVGRPPKTFILAMLFTALITPSLSSLVSVGCSASEHVCDNGLCLNQNRLCDGNPDCNDWSDETNCSKLLFFRLIITNIACL